MATPPTTLLWDRTNLPPATTSPPKLLSNNTSGGVGIGNGSEQIVGNTPPRWGLKLTDIPLNTADRIRSWNVMKGMTQGRLVPFLVPVFDRNRAPSTPSTVKLDGQVFSGQTAIQIKVATAGGQVSPGMFFQLEESLYLLTSMGDGTPDDPYTSFPVTIIPPLRSESNDNVPCHFDDPWFRVRLATDDEMNDVDLEAKKFGKGTINVVEDA